MPILEPILQKKRINKVLPDIKPNSVVVDVGCDNPPKLLKLIASKMEYCIGIDEAISYSKKGNIETFNQKLNSEIKLETNSADVITMMAVLEHLKKPKDILKECFRILNPGGTLLITIPLKKSNIIPFISSEVILNAWSSLGLIRKEMIDQHENYFTPTDLEALLDDVGFSKIVLQRFELGYNAYVKATK
ncbi:methyltransferase domain-containing protein [Patescibacteria group bacterium]